jgi:hypothetical protein
MNEFPCKGEMRDEYKILFENLRLHGRSGRRWEYHIRLDLRETWQEVVDMAGSCEHDNGLSVPYSRRTLLLGVSWLVYFIQCSHFLGKHNLRYVLI